MPAEAGFAEEEPAGIPAYASNRTYRDTWPAEVLCAPGPTEALCGFRDPIETYRLFEEFGVLGARDLRELNDGSSRSRRSAEGCLPALASPFGGERAVIHQAAGVAESFRGTGPVGSFATIRELAAHYPADPGN